MAHHTRTMLDRSPDAMAALEGQLATFDDGETLQTELQAHAFSQQCLREIEEDERLNRTETLTTEVLEVLVTPAAGALSTWKTQKDFPIGSVANLLLGSGAKAVSVWNPDNRGVRVAGRVGKVLLHSQLSIITRTLIQGTP
ncbi:hypothetical protein [Enhygromyxa salina]|uniref:Uncharacterized protein n=1 Tax=Enhygromyxa salina TaxID=215803 RepID=A0A2S9YAC1_9BACT|nr:hypothetical protein [Enhygromyxa salina]PRQ02045.1 hypothetical protein ENSA7_56180 [Enhygromyxa salina]